MTNDDTAEAIRQRMAELRRNVATDMREVRRSAQKMASPMFYVRRFPWASIAVAAVVGYALVPRKKNVVTPDPETLAELVRKQQVKIDTSEASQQSQSLPRSLALMGLTWGVRTGLGYMGRRLAEAALNPNAGGKQVQESTAQPETLGTSR